MRPILNGLPETLDETYERILQEIPKSNRIYAHRLLQCLTVAVRPLHVKELAEVLAVDLDATGGIPKLNENLRWEDQEQAMLSACSSLITTVVATVWDMHGSPSRVPVVQFSHFSVKEYLTSERLTMSTTVALRHYHILLEPSHTIMTQACLSVLLRLDSHVNKEKLEDFPLAQYASQYFGDHAEFGNVFAHIRDGIDDLLDADKPHFAAWLWVREHLQLEEPSEQPEAPPLYHVAGFGFRAMVDYLISKRPDDLSARGHYGIPLHASLQNGHADVALLLLGHCVDADIRGIGDRTPLHMAADSGLLEVTRILIDQGANINARDSNGRTPLLPIFDDNRPGTFDDTYFEVVRYLLERGADVDAQAKTEHSSLLHLASYCRGLKVAQLLLDRGVNIDVRGVGRQTPLHGALTDLHDNAPECGVDAVRFLLDQGADLHAEDDNRWTPLHVISRYGNEKAVLLLLERGAQVDARDTKDSIPLHVASRHGNAKVAHLLLKHGADVHALDGNHSTPLHFASEGGNHDVARLLLEHGANVRSLNNNRSTPLHFISSYRGGGAARVLLEQGAVVDARDSKDSTPLHLSSRLGNTKFARVLLEHGADVHALNANHSSPLHLASESGNLHAARLLLEYGANVYLQNNEGNTPSQVASAEGHDEIGRLFSEHLQE